MTAKHTVIGDDRDHATLLRAAFGKGSIVVRPSYMAFDLKLLEERRGAP